MTLQPTRQEILDECRGINNEISDHTKLLLQLRILHNEALRDSRQNPEIDNIGSRLKTDESKLAERITSLEGAASPLTIQQVGLCRQRLARLLREHREIETQIRHDYEEQLKRRYLIVYPEASEQEAANQATAGIFTQALNQRTTHRGDESTLIDNQTRHKAIKRIAEDVGEVADLFHHMNATVIAQEPSVTQVAEESERVGENLQSANNNLDGAIRKAKARNRKKRWCLFVGSKFHSYNSSVKTRVAQYTNLLVLILLVIVAIIAVLAKLGANGLLGAPSRSTSRS